MQTINHGETTSPNNNLIERKQVEGTPFTIIKQTTDNDKEIYFLIMGDHRLTEPTETEEETLEKIITEHWKILTTVTAIIVDKSMQIWMEQQRKAEQNELKNIFENPRQPEYNNK